MADGIELQIAKMIWPEIDAETIQIYKVYPTSTEVVVPYFEENRGGMLSEHIELRRLSISLSLGYGPKTNVLVIKTAEIKEEHMSIVD